MCEDRGLSAFLSTRPLTGLKNTWNKPDGELLGIMIKSRGYSVYTDLGIEPILNNTSLPKSLSLPRSADYWIATLGSEVCPAFWRESEIPSY